MPLSRVRRIGVRALGTVAGLGFLAVLPFFVLIRGSVYLDRVHGWNAWLSVGVAAAAAAAVLSFYAFRLWQRLTGSGRYVFISTRIVSPAVLVVCVVGLTCFGSANAKDPVVHGSYRTLHPALRLAVASLCLFDEDLVLTDIRRSPDAYRAMALPVLAQSKHYVQQDGFVHAIDLRTLGHGAPRNLLTQAW